MIGYLRSAFQKEVINSKHAYPLPSNNNMREDKHFFSKSKDPACLPGQRPQSTEAVTFINIIMMLLESEVFLNFALLALQITQDWDCTIAYLYYCFQGHCRHREAESHKYRSLKPETFAPCGLCTKMPVWFFGTFFLKFIRPSDGNKILLHAYNARLNSQSAMCTCRHSVTFYIWQGTTWNYDVVICNCLLQKICKI